MRFREIFEVDMKNSLLGPAPSAKPYLECIIHMNGSPTTTCLVMHSQRALVAVSPLKRTMQNRSNTRYAYLGSSRKSGQSGSQGLTFPRAATQTCRED